MQTLMLSKNFSGGYGRFSGEKLSQIRGQQPQKHVSFGSADKSGVLRKMPDFFIDGFNSILKNGMGQTASNIINYTGKALLPPLMILAGSQFSDTDEEAIGYSMLMPPVKAGLSLVTAVFTSFIANRFVEKAGKKGMFGAFFKQPDNLKELKNMSTLGMTFMALPLASKILGWALPKMMKKIKGITDGESVTRNLYAEGLFAYNLDGGLNYGD